MIAFLVLFGFCAFIAGSVVACAWFAEDEVNRYQAKQLRAKVEADYRRQLDRWQ